jgi:hypothetical protein
VFYAARHPSTVLAVTLPLTRNADPAEVTGHWTALSEDQADAALEYALANGLLGVLADRLEQLGCLALLPKDIAERLRDALAEGARMDAALLDDMRALVQGLNERGIPALILKGGAWRAELYDRPGVRPRRDIDLLVEPRALNDAAAVAASLGYRTPPNARAAGQHLPRLERQRLGGGKAALDLHHRMVPTSIYGKRFPLDETLWQRTVSLDLGDGVTGTTLSRLDHVIHMHIHLLHHLFYNFRLMHLFDVALAARRWRADVDPDAVAAWLDGLGLARLVDDVRVWLHDIFNDDVGSPRGPRSRRDADMARHVLGRGSLPDLAGMRYAVGIRECLAMLPRELRRLGFRLRKPEARAPQAWSTP